MKILGNRILIKPLPQDTKSRGGIHLVDNYNDNQMLFEVLDVGPGRRVKGSLLPPEVSVGDRIIAHSFQSNVHVFDDGRKIIDADGVMLVLGK